MLELKFIYLPQWAKVMCVCSGGAFEVQLQFLVATGVPVFVAMSILFVGRDKSPAQCFL